MSCVQPVIPLVPDPADCPHPTLEPVCWGDETVNRCKECKVEVTE